MSRAIYNAKNEYIGRITESSESGEAYDKNGKLIGSYSNGWTYSEGMQPYGEGNLLTALVYSSADK